MLLELFKEKIAGLDSKIPCTIGFLKNYEYSVSDFGMFLLEPEALKTQTVSLEHSKTNERTIKLYYWAPIDASWVPDSDIKYQITFLEDALKGLSKDKDILKRVVNFDYIYTLRQRKIIENSYIKEVIFEVIINIKER